MAKREYGQYCGLARAAEILGQRWTMLIMRDLLVEAKRYSDLATGLPGIPSNLLSTRLKELESDGLIRREARSGDRKSTRLNSSHVATSYAVFCLKKKNIYSRQR